jgi:hypothetical protein
MGGIYEVRVEMGSGAMTYIPSFIKTGFGIQRLIRGIHIQADRHTHRQQSDFISLLLFSQSKKSRLILRNREIVPLGDRTVKHL